MAVNWCDFVVPAVLVVDLCFGDPVYAWHPIRLLGKLIGKLESWLFARGLQSKAGGVLLVLALVVMVVIPLVMVHALLWNLIPPLGFVWDVFWGYHGIALRDLLDHTRRIGQAVQLGDLPKARHATSMLVGRDTEPMDGHACCRAGIESLSENLTDGVISPLFWLILFGLPGLLVFKIASTLDSMVGYKNERYMQFGWAGARLDDVMNWIPARLTWLCTVCASLVLKGFSAKKAWRIGLKQHKLAPGPNSGWSESAFAGALELRIAGPIWKGGVMVTDVWLGHPTDRAEATPADIRRASKLAIATTAVFVVVAKLV